MDKAAQSVGFGALAVALLLAAACGPAAAPSPTVAPAKPPVEQAAPKPTSAPAAAAEPKAAASPATSAASAPAASPAAAPAFNDKAVADFYTGKTVRIVVGFSPGGGYDTYSRTIAKHLGRHIPGGPTVIVENKPGAGSLIAANEVYNAAPKDGTVVGNIGGVLILEQVFGAKGVEFDMAKFQHLPVPVPESYLMIMHKRAGINSLKQLLETNGKQAVLGGIPDSTLVHGPALLRDALGANIKLVSGYQGTSKVRLAIESGEVDGFFNSWQSVKITNREQIESGEWVVLAQFTEQPIKGLPVQAPTLKEFTKDDEQLQLLLFGVTNPNAFGKAYVLAPEVPSDRVAALEAAFMKTMTDKEFLADAEKAKLEIDPLPGERVRKLVADTLGMSPAVKAKLHGIIQSSGQ